MLERWTQWTLYSSVIVGILVAAHPVAARLIDEFSDESGVLTADASIDTGTCIGGERDIDFNTTAEFETLGGAARVDGLGGGLRIMGFFWDGNDGSGANSLDLPDIDLTDAGDSDRFVLELVELSGSLNLRIRVYDDSLSDFSSTPFTVITTAGTHEFLFADLVDDSGVGADLTSINRIQLNLLDLDSGESIEIDRFVTAGPGAGPIPLDPFRIEQPSASATTGGRIDDDPEVIGGERELAMGGCPGWTVEVSNGSGRLDCPANGTGQLGQVTYDGDDDSATQTYGLPDLDFSDGGAHDRLRVYVGPPSGAVSLTLRAWEDSSTAGSSLAYDFFWPGFYDFPFASFDPVDFTSIDMLKILSTFSPTGELAIDHIETLAPPPIDLFEGGPETLSTSSVQEDPMVIGMERDIHFPPGLGASFEVVDGVGTLVVTSNPGNDDFLLTYDGIDKASTFVSSSLREDLTRAGHADRLAIDVASLSAAAGQITIRVGRDAGNKFIHALALNSGPGVYEVPLAGFSVEAGTPSLEDVRFMTFLFEGFASGESIGLDSIDLLPEPGRFTQLAVGLLALLALTPCRRGASNATRGGRA